LLLLAALFTLATGASHLYVYIQSDISKEVHRKFFIHWTSKFAEKMDAYVYILREEEEDDDQLQRIPNDYSSIGLPGCIGSVDCVQIGWNQCPAYQKNIFKGSKGVLQLFLRWFLIAEEIFYQSATYNQEQEMTNT
jgi:hypothetical protein